MSRPMVETQSFISHVELGATVRRRIDAPCEAAVSGHGWLRSEHHGQACCLSHESRSAHHVQGSLSV